MFYKKKIKNGMVETLSPINYLVDTLIIIFLLAFMFVCTIPIWHILMSSFSDGLTLLANDSLVVKPVGNINFEGYKLIFQDDSIINGYINTLIYVVGSTMLGLAINVLGGYCMSRQTKFKPAMVLFVLFTMMFSGGLIPGYMVLRNLGMVGTMWAIIIPGCTNGIFLVLTMNAFASVPESIVEAARIDGAGHIRVMFQIMLPQAMSMITVVILYSVVMQWNSWFPAAIYLANQRDLWPLQLFIKDITARNRDFLQSQNPNYSRYIIQYALIVIATMPILLSMPFFIKYFEKGILLGGVKE